MKHLFIVALFFSFSFCQAAKSNTTTDTTRIISGKVTSTEMYSPLEGVAVLVKGTRNLTGTMVDGAFSLFVPARDSVLVVSLDGYETKEVKLTAEIFYEVVLKHADNNLTGQTILTTFHSQLLATTNR